MVEKDVLKYLEYCKMSGEQVRVLSSSFNYDDLVDFCIYLLKEKEFLALEGAKTLLDIVVDNIWDKYENNPISKKELMLLLDIFFLDNLEYFKLENVDISMKYVPSGNPKLMGKLGCCYHNLKRDSFKIYMADNTYDDVLDNNKFVNLYGAFIMLGHEQAHIRQVLDEIEKVDLETFLITLESAARYHDRDYYVINYEHLFGEDDANNKAGYAFHNFFRKHKLTNEEGLSEIEAIYDKEKQKNIYNFINSKTIYSEKEDFSLNHLFNMNKKLLRLHNFFFDSFPLLRISHNSDGSIKTISELVRDRKEKIDNKDPNIAGYNDIYNFIFNNYYNVSLEEAIDIEKKEIVKQEEKVEYIPKKKSLFRNIFSKKGSKR